MKQTLILIYVLFSCAIVRGNDGDASQNDKLKKVFINEYLYEEIPFCKDITCLAYNHEADSIKQINHYFVKNADQIEELLIENPSHILSRLKLNKLKSLKVFEIFGNDFNMDAIDKLPRKLFKLESLELIKIEGVLCSSYYIDKMKKKYPHIEFDVYN